MLFRVLELATRLYRDFSSATVSLRIVEQDILKAAWLPKSMKDILRDKPCEPRAHNFNRAVLTTIEDHVRDMTREKWLACVAMSESGHFNIDPEKLREVIAICHEDSIFVAEVLISDPGVELSELGLRHMIGNVGQPGMILMVSPVEPRIRAAEYDLTLVGHYPYNCQVADKLEGTSLHLSFTTWKMPLDWENTGTIDQEIFLFESVVSVKHNGKWIADIDVLKREKERPNVLSFPCQCEAKQDNIGLDIVSLDSWCELLDAPPCIGVLRAHKNWAARLAAVSILAQQGGGKSVAIINDSRICWPCLKNKYTDPNSDLPRVFIF